jgi:multiple sugar transport system substrate-binding protein
MKEESFLSKFGAFKDSMLHAIDHGNSNYLPQVPQANEIINMPCRDFYFVDAARLE